MKAEKIIIAAIVVALVLRFFHVPFNPLLLILSILSLGIFYIAWAKDSLRKKGTTAKVSGIIFLIVLLGILFKLLFWPGGAFYLLFGAVGGVIILIVAIAQRSKVTDATRAYNKAFFIRTIVLTVLAICLYLTPVTTLIKIQYWNDPELGKLKTYLITEEPTKEEYEKRFNEYKLRKDSLERAEKK